MESSRLITKSFNRYPEYIPTDDIVEDTFIICGAGKVLGSKKMFSVSTLDDPKRLKKNPRDDYFVVKTLRDVLSQCDILIHHNGDHFDLPLLRSRVMFHRLPALPPIKTIDTYRQLKSQSPTSASLDWLAKQAGIEQKPHTGKALWEGCENGDIASLKKMLRYNRHDVMMTEQVYNFYKPYIKNNPIEKFARKPQCPKCGMNSLVIDGHKTKVNGQKTIHYRCKSCYQYSTI